MFSDVIRTRAARAQEILDDPVFQDAVKGVVDKSTRDWISTNALAVDAREAAYHRVKSVDALVHELRSIVTEAKVADFKEKRTPVKLR